MLSGVARDPNSRESAKDRGDGYFDKMNYAGALIEYNKAIKCLDSKVQIADYYLARGNTLERLDRHDEAWSDLRKALQIREKAVLYGDLADTYQGIGVNIMAEKYYGIAILMDPRNEKYRKGLKAVQGNK